MFFQLLESWHVKLRRRPNFLTKKDKSVTSTIRACSGGLKMPWLICGLRGIHRYIDCCEICDLRCPAIDKSVSSTIRACSGRLEMAWLICGLRGIYRYIDCCEICDLRCCSNRRSDLTSPRFEIISISTKLS